MLFKFGANPSETIDHQDPSTKIVTMDDCHKPKRKLQETMLQQRIPYKSINSVVVDRAWHFRGWTHLSTPRKSHSSSQRAAVSISPSDHSATFQRRNESFIQSWSIIFIDCRVRSSQTTTWSRRRLGGSSTPNSASDIIWTDFQLHWANSADPRRHAWVCLGLYTIVKGGESLLCQKMANQLSLGSTYITTEKVSTFIFT